MSLKQTTQQTAFDLDLTPQDINLYKAFRTLCKADNKTVVSSDDFRMYQLDRFVKDKQHGIGGLFAKWKRHGLIMQVGHARSIVASNNMREIRTYQFTEKKAEL